MGSQGLHLVSPRALSSTPRLTTLFEPHSHSVWATSDFPVGMFRGHFPEALLLSVSSIQYHALLPPPGEVLSSSPTTLLAALTVLPRLWPPSSLNTWVYMLHSLPGELQSLPWLKLLLNADFKSLYWITILRSRPVCSYAYQASHMCVPKASWAHRVQTKLTTFPSNIFLFLCSLGEGKGNPLQDCCLENPMDRAAWSSWGCRVGHDWATNTSYVPHRDE